MFLFVLACAAREPTLSTAPPMVQQPPPSIDLGTQWVHRSDAHQAVLATIYQNAGEALAVRAQALEPDTAWAIVSDVDETLVDNSEYQNYPHTGRICLAVDPPPVLEHGDHDNRQEEGT